ncbi:MAG: hypothetical protein SFX73_38360 [Kofleriaceae bacterium]|nr:hypothetical protein [Kofleriaceae bacterium]
MLEERLAGQRYAVKIDGPFVVIGDEPPTCAGCGARLRTELPFS